MIDLKKAIHLVNTNSGKDNLTHYFKTNYPNDKIQIHCISDPLTVGPLNDLTSSSDYNAYASYWITIEKICNPNYVPQAKDYFQSPNFLKQFKVSFSKDTSLIIWHGNEAAEQLMLYRYCNLLKDRDLYEIDLKDWKMNTKETNSNCLATLNPKDLDGIFNNIKKIDASRKSFYAKEWERLKKDKKLTRILKNEKMISVEEDYYDKNILDNCTPEYKNAANVIGETMETQESTIGDYSLFYRVHVLISQKVLEYRGDLSEIHHLEIKTNS